MCFPQRDVLTARPLSPTRFYLEGDHERAASLVSSYRSTMVKGPPDSQGIDRDRLCVVSWERNSYFFNVAGVF
jgi:hypothetical protein